VTERMLIPVVLPSWLASSLRRLKRAFIPQKAVAVLPNIDGERYVEWSFLSSHLPGGSGEAIDFGCEKGYMSLLAAQKGFHVLACDLQQQHFLWKHPNVEFVLGDFLDLDLPLNHFDLIINCSSVEHVGVAGRYDITLTEMDGDLEVMVRFFGTRQT
jgi:2-polyprenyl-3-methyl-5-hydroxy-6-metoxy-1,4-benzoquinol methylase